MKNKILIIDDDKKLNDRLSRYLPKFGFVVVSATHPFEGLKMLKQNQPDLIILDVMLPDMEGFEVCKKIREEFSVPIIMLTARGEVMDRIVGLELGADDYMPKPFEPRELVARIKTILRRSQIQSVSDIKEYGDLIIDFTKHIASLNSRNIYLTSADFKILSYFVKKAGKVLSREQILDQLRGLEWDAFNRSIDVLISRLRQKLEDDPKNSQYIKTVWGTGYMFIGEENYED